MSKIRLLAYYFRRNNWLFDPRFYKKYELECIINPIFLLGNQGDGITFFSRMLRRNDSIVSCSGNSDYWTGADEMQTVFELALSRPFRMTSAILRSDFSDNMVKEPRSWSYAKNDLVSQYIVENISEKDKLKYLHILAYCLNRFKPRDKSARFLDKSQSYLLKVKAIQDSMKWTNVYFLHVTRDPYVTIYRAATGKAGDLLRSKNLSFDEKLEIATQHWLNKAKYILEVRNSLKFYKQIKFEDILNDPEFWLKESCSFLDLDFNADMLPQPYHKIPFATKYVSRWYPIRQGANNYEIPDSIYNKLRVSIGETAHKFGY